MAKSNIIAILDIGTSKIVCLIALAKKNGDLRIMGWAVQASSGFKSGIVTDLKKAEATILKVIRDAEKSCSEHIGKLVVSICNNNLYSQLIKTSIVNGNNTAIGEKEILKITAQGLEQYKKEYYDVIHNFPLEYELDGQRGIVDPISMYGKELSATMHVISTPTVAILNIANCLARCQIEVEDFIVAPYAAAIACLNHDDMSIGCLLIDIGATITCVSIYDNNNFIFTDTLPLGGWHISSDIAQCFSLNFDHAERIKIIHGNVISTTLDEHKSFDLNELKDLDEETTERNFIKAKELSQVIKPRAEEIFEMVLHLLKKRNMWQHRHKRIILTGGSSSLQGMRDLAAYMLGGSVRLASAQSIHGMPIHGIPEEYKSTAFASAMGMLRIANNNRIKANVLAMKHKNNGIFKKLLKWF